MSSITISGLRTTLGTILLLVVCQVSQAQPQVRYEGTKWENRVVVNRNSILSYQGNQPVWDNMLVFHFDRDGRRVPGFKQGTHGLFEGRAEIPHLGIVFLIHQGVLSENLQNVKFNFDVYQNGSHIRSGNVDLYLQGMLQN